MTEDPDWFAGVDWASELHQATLLNDQGTVIGERAFPHGGAGLAAMCDWFLANSRAPAGSIAIAIEVPHGPVVETLLERGFLVHAINPKQLDRFRDRFTVAGAKDDRLDARVLADSLRTDRHCFRPLRLAEPIVVELRAWSRMAEDLQQERTRLGNRVREQLWRYYPQALELTDDVAADWFLTLWALAPTPAKAARVHQETIARHLKAHRIRRVDADETLRILRQTPISVAGGTTEAATAHIRAVAVRLTVVNRQIKQANRQLDALCARLAGSEPAGSEPAGSGETEPGQNHEQRDVTILRSLPGVGRIVLATLLAEAWQPLRQRDYHALRSLCGVAPVTRRSGKRCVVVMRQACHMRLRGAVYHWARTAIQHDPRSRTRYAELRKRGHSHGRALRTVGDRLLGVACAMLETGTRFDPAHAGTMQDAA
jgi:transposase